MRLENCNSGDHNHCRVNHILLKLLNFAKFLSFRWGYHNSEFCVSWAMSQSKSKKKPTIIRFHHQAGTIRIGILVVCNSFIHDGYNHWLVLFWGHCIHDCFNDTNVLCALKKRPVLLVHHKKWEKDTFSSHLFDSYLFVFYESDPQYKNCDWKGLLIKRTYIYNFKYNSITLNEII